MKLQETVYYDSSVVSKSVYYPNELKLILTFSSSDVYTYENVSIKIYEEFRDSDSQGKLVKELSSKNGIAYEKDGLITLTGNDGGPGTHSKLNHNFSYLLELINGKVDKSR